MSSGTISAIATGNSSRSPSPAARTSSAGEERRHEPAVVCQQPSDVSSPQFGDRRRSQPRGRRDYGNRGKGSGVGRYPNDRGVLKAGARPAGGGGEKQSSARARFPRGEIDLPVQRCRSRNGCRGRRPRGMCFAVAHDVPLHRFLSGVYTRDGDAEPGSRCKPDMVLATVTRELESHVATGRTGLGRRGASARPGSHDRLHRRVVPIHERWRVCADGFRLLIAGHAAITGGRGWRCRTVVDVRLLPLSRGRPVPSLPKEQ